MGAKIKRTALKLTVENGGTLEFEQGSAIEMQDANDGDILVCRNGSLVPTDLLSLMLDEHIYTPNLEIDSWAIISRISESGQAANYYAVGDTKTLEVRGTVGTFGINKKLRCYIIGFDHNSAVEGRGISFGTFKTVESSPVDESVDVALVDMNYSDESVNSIPVFNINHYGNANISDITGDLILSTYTYGGWRGCDLRYDVLGSTDTAPNGYGSVPAEGRIGYDASPTTATNPVPNTLMSCLPSDLRVVMKPITKVDGDRRTIDYLPLLSEKEIYGYATTSGVDAAANQQQYEYYINGGTPDRYSATSTTTQVWHWLRSVVNEGGLEWLAAQGDRGEHSVVSISAAQSRGICPIFKV